MAEATASAAAKQAAYDAKVAEEQRQRALANQMMEEERRRQQALQAAAVGGSRKAKAKPSVDADPDDPAVADDPEQEEMSFLQKVYNRTLKMANIVLPSTKKMGTQTGSPAYQEYRAGERNAEEIAADYERHKAIEKIGLPSGGGSKVLQSPLKSRDGLLVIFGIIMIVMAFAVHSYNNRYHNVEGVCTAERTLASCFERNGRKEFSPGEQIDQEEFDELLEVIYNDIDKTPRNGWDILPRASYDTPFFTGNSRGENKYPDNIVCIGDRCDQQSHVNYIAQGMYSAKAGESLEGALGWVTWWNENINQSQAQPGEYYWTEFGYNYFFEQQENE